MSLFHINNNENGWTLFDASIIRRQWVRWYRASCFACPDHKAHTTERTRILTVQMMHAGPMLDEQKGLGTFLTVWTGTSLLQRLTNPISLTLVQPRGPGASSLPGSGTGPLVEVDKAGTPLGHTWELSVRNPKSESRTRSGDQPSVRTNNLTSNKVS